MSKLQVDNKYSINKPHGVMFHHFYNDDHPKGQGAINAEEFDKLLNFVGVENILSPKSWYEKAISKNLKPTDICLSFDDALKCQFDIAVPVLEKYNLTAFWFVYSGVLKGKHEWLEIYRYFRTVYFKDINDFYEQFNIVLNENSYDVEKLKESTDISNYLNNFKFYSYEDRLFRYLRDRVVKSDYNKIMRIMMYKFDLDLAELTSKLWMSVDDIKYLNNNNHIVGLHSETHPTDIASLELREQQDEYQENYNYLSAMLDKKPISMSHPCNSYSKETISILKNLGISLGFRADMKDSLNESNLEFPREDHSHIIELMGT